MNLNESTDIQPLINECRIPVFQPTETIGHPGGGSLSGSMIRRIADDILSIRHITHVGSFNLEFPFSSCGPKVRLWRPCGGEMKLFLKDDLRLKLQLFQHFPLTMICSNCCTCLTSIVPEFVLQNAFLHLAIKQMRPDWMAGNFIHANSHPSFQAIQHLGTIALAGKEFLHGLVHDGRVEPHPFAFTLSPGFNTSHGLGNQSEWTRLLFSHLSEQGKALSGMVSQITMGPRPVSA